MQTEENVTRWSAAYEAVKVKRDEAAKRFERVQTLFAELIDLFREAEAVDAEISNLHGSSPERGASKTFRALNSRLAGFRAFLASNRRWPQNCSCPTMIEVIVWYFRRRQFPRRF